MNSKNYPNCNNCAADCKGPSGAVPVYCEKYIAPKSGFPFPECISRFTFFKNPSKLQQAVRAYCSGRPQLDYNE